MKRAGPRAATILITAMIIAASTASASTAKTASSDAALSELLKAQTQQFSEAGQKGDRATLDRLLDAKVVFTNETGETGTKKDVLAGAAPAPGQRHIEVTEWSLTRQGDVATATFVDVLTQRSGEQDLIYRYNSTEVWAKRPSGWKMIASQTMVVPRDPPAIRLPTERLDEYLGLYRANATTEVRITKAGDGLESSTNGAPPQPLQVELRDVLFTPGAAPGLRIFQRDAAGRVIGYIARRNGNDMLFKKIS